MARIYGAHITQCDMLSTVGCEKLVLTVPLLWSHHLSQLALISGHIGGLLRAALGL